MNFKDNIWSDGGLSSYWFVLDEVSLFVIWICYFFMFGGNNTFVLWWELFHLLKNKGHDKITWVLPCLIVKLFQRQNKLRARDMINIMYSVYINSFLVFTETFTLDGIVSWDTVLEIMYPNITVLKIMYPNNTNVSHIWWFLI